MKPIGFATDRRGLNVMTPAEARRRLAHLHAYREMLGPSRPADLPAIDAAIGRFRAIAGQLERQEEKA